MDTLEKPTCRQRLSWTSWNSHPSEIHLKAKPFVDIFESQPLEIHLKARKNFRIHFKDSRGSNIAVKLHSQTFLKKDHQKSDSALHFARAHACTRTHTTLTNKYQPFPDILERLALTKNNKSTNSIQDVLERPAFRNTLEGKAFRGQRQNRS